MTDDKPSYMKPIPMVNVNRDDKPTCECGRPGKHEIWCRTDGHIDGICGCGCTVSEKAEWERSLTAFSDAAFDAIEKPSMVNIAGITKKHDAARAAVHRALDERTGDTHIYCPNCGDTKPLLRAWMPADGRNDHAATDLLCGWCKFVVATIHHLDTAAEKRARGNDGD